MEPVTVCDHGGKLRFVCVAVSQTRLGIIFVCMPLLLHMGRLLADQASHGWTDTLNFLHRGCRNLMDHILFCMVFQTVVHYL
ncbi:hypothetical protein HID58_034198 [Brassica napus]|uniref:Uncharacterized protein n=1 Tax=Brassica napus TaxID=3708 RepID=A0ABQ8C1C1_BRANA|nr:hypothetical protein HID58_034198 [Brassica napus]